MEDKFLKKLKSISKDLKFIIPANKYEIHKKEKENKTDKQMEAASGTRDLKEVHGASPYASIEPHTMSKQYMTEKARKNLDRNSVNLSLSTVNFNTLTRPPISKEPKKAAPPEPLPTELHVQLYNKFISHRTANNKDYFSLILDSAKFSCDLKFMAF